MKKLSMLLICLFAMLAAGKDLRAQEITITLNPNWNWISYPNAEPMTIASALGDFVPKEGDMIKSMDGVAKFSRNHWIGSVTHFIPGWGYKYYSTRTETVEFSFAQPSSTSVATATPTDITTTSAVVGGTVTVSEGSHVFLRGVCWGTASNPDIDGDHTTEETGIGSFTSTLMGLNSNTTYFVRAYAVTDHGLAYGNELSFTTETGGGSDHEYVDLGLPSGLLWATCNVGANAPEDYGDYFAWGETQPKDYYDWSTYQYGNDWNQLTKYCNSSGYGYNGFTDNLTNLLPEDDAATANWGNGWRMPTTEEFQELYNNTTVTWTQQGGVNGRLFTASNGNSLFLPAAGGRWDDELLDVGYYGYYWSSSLTDTPVEPWFFYFDPFDYYMYHDTRLIGLSVRAVRPASLNPSFNIDVTASPSEGGTVTGTGNYAEGSTCTLTATANAGYTFVNWTENGEEVSAEATYSFTVEADRTLVANFAVSGGDHAYVDLGLPSGTMWATCNVGANSPEDYGDYFAWGETQPKDTYNWSTYQYGDGNTFTKYTGSDDLTTLLPEDDAATANWGDNWRMPTQEELEELCNNTTVTWTQQNGVNGRLFTASNGNSLFLPAAGCRYNSDLLSAGSWGFYWSSSLRTDYPIDAWCFLFNSDYFSMNYNNRDGGFTVRPVCSASQNTSFNIDATVSPSEGGTVTGTGNYAEGSTCTLIATANAGYIFINWTENGEVVSAEATYPFTVEADRTLVANFAVSGGDHAYVDLGLPSGLLWATCNVGANAPEEYGDYFAWGETQPKDIYNSSTYQYCNGGDGWWNTLTKYCTDSNYGYNGFIDNLTILEPSDDAATANWGSDWRMPTKEEWQELYQNTTVTWTTQNGVNGCLFTASNGNSLFLPAAGYRGNSGLDYAGSLGNYWSSSLNTDDPYDAWYFDFGSGGCGMSYSLRDCGQSVRGVRSSRQN